MIPGPDLGICLWPVTVCKCYSESSHIFVANYTSAVIFKNIVFFCCCIIIPLNVCESKYL